MTRSILGVATAKAWACAAVMVLSQPFLACAAPAADNGAVILLYHRFGEDSLPSTNVRLDQFEAQLAVLASGLRMEKNFGSGLRVFV